MTEQEFRKEIVAAISELLWVVERQEYRRRFHAGETREGGVWTMEDDHAIGRTKAELKNRLHKLHEKVDSQN